MSSRQSFQSSPEPDDDRDRPDDEFTRQARRALAHLHDPAYLQTLHLMPRQALGPSDRLSTTVRGTSLGRSLQQGLIQAIDSLRPNASSPARARTSGLHELLTLRYLEALEIRAICDRLGVGRSEYFRDHRRALVAVASILNESWRLRADRELADRESAEERSERAIPAPPTPLVARKHHPRGSPGEPHVPSSAQAGGTRMSNLPLQLTSFVGREREIAEVSGLLGTTRLLTLTGTGGCGKTRLALQVAEGLRRDTSSAYPDGVCLVELAGLAEPRFVPQTVALALGLREQPSEPIIVSLQSYLQSRHLLLILDNCEHLLDGCASLVDSVLRTCPKVQLLATSREVLGISGETSYRVPSLSQADPRQLPAWQSLIEYESVRLFLERARASQPSFELSERTAVAVAQICWRLDGIPLAIELAAARTRGLTVEQLAQRLGDRFRLLTSGSRTALPRQQTLRATIDWSHALLSEPEKVLLRRLAVFAGGFSLEAAEEVCTSTTGEAADQPAIEGTDVLDLLMRLVDRSLVLAEEADRQARYRLLETIRQYAQEKLADSGEVESLRQRQAAYFLGVAVEANRHLQGPDQAAWLDRLGCDHDNLRAALRFAIEREDAELGLRLVASLSYFWYFRGHFGEGRELPASVLALPLAPGLAPLRAEPLRGAGMLAVRQGDYSAARAYLDEALAIVRQVGDPRLLAPTLATLGLVALVQDDYATARPALEETLIQARKVGDTFHTAMALHHLGLVALEADRDLDLAWSLNEQSLALYREIGNRRMVGADLGDLGRVARARGKLAAARALLAEAVTTLRETGDFGPMPRMLYILASVDGDEERFERAVWLQSAAQRHEEAVGTRVWPGNLREREGWLARARSALGEEVFARTWAEAQAMTLEQAVEYALRDDHEA